MKYLLIAEKPSLMRTIKAIYDKGNFPNMDIDFMAQAGHIMRLKMPNEIDPIYKKWDMKLYPIENMQFRYTVMDDKKDLFLKIRSAIQSGKYDAIIHAGDPDQEGELLVRLVLTACKNTLPVYRFWSNDLTEGAVTQALKRLHEDKEYNGYYNAALLRQHMDYRYGMNLSPVMSLKMGPTIRIGRVKAPIVKLIADRENEIKAFKPHSDFTHAFEYKGYSFSGTGRYKTEKEAADSMPKSAVITDVSDKVISRKAPALFKLSTLQQAASSAYGISAADTLKAAQNLYEQKLLSYPRTDCEYLASHTDIISILKNLDYIDFDQSGRKDLETVVKDKSYFNDKAIASEGHTALIPTGEKAGTLSGNEAKIYDLVSRRFAAIFAADKKVRNIKAKAVSDTEEQFDMSASDELFPGWELVINPKHTSKHCSNEALEKGPVSNPKWNVKEIKAKCPARYTDATLIGALDHPDKVTGITYKVGTPATRAGIIEDCIRTGYFTREKGKYTATELALDLVKELGFVDVFDIKTTALWEEEMSKIRRGEKTDAEARMTAALNDDIEKIKAAKVTYKPSTSKSSKIVGACPLCGKPVFENSKAYGCSGWKEGCNFTIWKNWMMQVTFTKADAKKFCEGQTVTKTVTSKAGKSWKQQLYFNAEKGKVDFYGK